MDPTFNRIIKEIQKVLASIFLIDDQSNEFVSKIKIEDNFCKENEPSFLTIRIPLSKGIAGYVYTTGQTLRIDDAYKDAKFSPELDKKMDFKTKTVIIGPIKDAKGKIIGVIQAANKINNVFDQDDVSLLQILAKIVSVYMSHSYEYGIIEINQSKLTKYIKSSFKLFNVNEFIELACLFQQMVKKIMNSEKCIIYIKEQSFDLNENENENQKFICIQNDGQIESFNELYGLIGKSYKLKQKLDMPDPEKEIEYNPKIDIPTHLPLLTIPILNSTKSEIIAIFQLSNLRTQVLRQSGKINYVEYEILDFLSKQFSYCFERIKEKQKMELK